MQDRAYHSGWSASKGQVSFAIHNINGGEKRTSVPLVFDGSEAVVALLVLAVLGVAVGSD